MVDWWTCLRSLRSQVQQNLIRIDKHWRRGCAAGAGRMIAFRLHSVIALREVMLQAKTEDLKTILFCISEFEGYEWNFGFLRRTLKGHWAILVRNSVETFEKTEWGRLNQWIVGKCGCRESR